MTRTFLQPDDVRDLVAEQFGAARRVTGLDRLAGGSKKGVYRLRLDDGGTTILYVWSAGENYWPPSRAVPDDPFTDASGPDLFAAAHAALAAAGVPTPRLLMLDRERRYLPADVALVEDAGGLKLEDLMESDPAAAAAPLAALGDALRRMHTTFGPHYGKLAAIARGEASQPGRPEEPRTGRPEEPRTGRPEEPRTGRPEEPRTGRPEEPRTGRPEAPPTGPEAPQSRRPEDIIVDRALSHLDEAAARDARLADAYERIAGHVRELRRPVAARAEYALVHGELGPDHVLVSPSGEPAIIDIEGLTYFDVEWEHAFLQLRFGDAYPALRPVGLDPHRLELYRYAQVLALIEGPLRIADTDFPERQWMLDLAEWNIKKALAV